MRLQAIAQFTQPLQQVDKKPRATADLVHGGLCALPVDVRSISSASNVWTCLCVISVDPHWVLAVGPLAQ